MAEKTVGQMIMQIEGLLGTRAVNDGESDFIEQMVEVSDHGKHTSHLSGKQVEWIRRIWGQHYAA